MEFVYLRFPKALKQAFLCTWAKYVVMPQKKEGDGEALKSSGHTTPLLWWNRWSPPPLGLGHQSQILLPPSSSLSDGLRVTGAGGHVPSALYPKANHSEGQLSGPEGMETT